MKHCCPECYGKMFFDAPNLVCKSCGLTLSRSEYYQLKADQNRQRLDKDLSNDDEDPKIKRQREYLAWYEGPKNKK